MSCVPSTPAEHRFLRRLVPEGTLQSELQCGSGRWELRKANFPGLRLLMAFSKFHVGRFMVDALYRTFKKVRSVPVVTLLNDTRVYVQCSRPCPQDPGINSLWLPVAKYQTSPTVWLAAHGARSGRNPPQRVAFVSLWSSRQDFIKGSNRSAL